MRSTGPFRPKDLESLDKLYSAHGTIPMRDVYLGDHDPLTIAVRHDVDDNEDSLATACEMAAWEKDRGYRTTYFFLHSASYWKSSFGMVARYFSDLGHEVGIHCNALAEQIRTGRYAEDILKDALAELRLCGSEVIGTVAHGDELCRHNGVVRFVNDEMFVECARPELGSAVRRIEGTNVTLLPVPLSWYGLSYDSNHLPRKYYASESGATWSAPWSDIQRWAAAPDGQLHLLIHPDWWGGAFA